MIYNNVGYIFLDRLEKVKGERKKSKPGAVG
jgi:hypothetical protein